MEELRCKKCNKLLARVLETKPYAIKINVEKNTMEEVETNGKQPDFFDGFLKQLEIKCPRCGEMNVRKENVEDGKEIHSKM